MRELFDHAFWTGPVKKVVIEGAAVSAEGVGAAKLLAEIEAAAIGVVQEKSVGRALARRDKERNGLVQRIGGFLPPERVRVPQSESEFAMIERAALVAQTKVVFVFRHGLPNAKCSAIERHGVFAPLFREDLAGGVTKGNSQR